MVVIEALNNFYSRIAETFLDAAEMLENHVDDGENHSPPLLLSGIYTAGVNLL